MLDYNRIAYEIDGIKAVPDDVDGLSMLQHFGYPEEWHYNGNTKFSDSAKFGKGCLYFPDAQSSVSVSNTTGMFNLNPYGNYELEAFVKLSEAQAGNILAVGNLELVVTSDNILHLSSSAWGIDTTSTDVLSLNTWHHFLLRISGETCALYVDGAQAISEQITGSGPLTPEAVTLGGYVGWLDEFVFRRNAGAGVPEVPTHPYSTETITETVEVMPNNAPVSRTAWSCENLPAGLTLSSAGVLSGRPTTAGTYECNVSVATNWGTDTKTIRIRIN